MSDSLDRFAKGIAENIIHALTSDSDDGFYESHIDSEGKSKQNLVSDTDETMEGFPSPNRNYVEENFPNVGDRFASNEDSQVTSVSSEKIGNSSKNNKEARHSDCFVPSQNPCYSATDHLSLITEDEFKHAESVNVFRNLDLASTREVYSETQRPNSVNIVDTSSLEADKNEVQMIKNKISRKLFDTGHVGTSIEKLGYDIFPLSETKSSQKLFGADRSKSEEQVEPYADCVLSQKVGFIEVSMRNNKRIELSTEAINEILKKLNICHLEEEEPTSSVALTEELPHNSDRSSEKHKSKQRRVGLSEMQCSVNKLETSNFDDRNSIAFGLPKANPEIRHRRSKDLSKEQSSEVRTLNVPDDRNEDVPEFVEEHSTSYPQQSTSTSSIKRRSDTQPEEPNSKFRKRCASSTDAETGEAIESRHHIRFASADNQNCNSNEGMKGTHTSAEALGHLQKRKRGPDEGLKTVLGESSKKLKKEVESDLMLKESEFSSEDSS